MNNFSNDDKVKDILMNKIISKKNNYKVLYQRQKKSLAESQRDHLRKSIDEMKFEYLGQSSAISTQK